jgi:hypothetical protein
MNARCVPLLSYMFVLLILTGCAGLGSNPPIPIPSANADAQAGRALLDRTQAAHGKAAFNALNDVNVTYSGKWFTIVTKLQSELTDVEFRQRSQEHMLLRDRLVAQRHTGPGGEKLVVRDGAQQKTSVLYNSSAHSAAGQLAASGLVVEAYQLFLYPAFAVERATKLERLPSEIVRDRTCDVLLAVLKPGIGDAADEDRVLLYIDQATGLVRRVRMTLEGYSGTKNAVVDMDLDRYVEVGGVQWPSYFYEYLVKPFNGLPAHEFSLTGIDVNRGLTRADFDAAQKSGKLERALAAPPTALKQK